MSLQAENFQKLRELMIREARDRQYRRDEMSAVDFLKQIRFYGMNIRVIDDLDNRDLLIFSRVRRR